MTHPPTIAEVRAAWAEGRLVGYSCEACGETRTSLVVRCAKCGSTKIGLKELPKTGKVVSHTIQLVAGEEFINEVPYAFAVIELDDGTRMTGWIPSVASDAELPAGQLVRLAKSYKPGLMFEKA